MKIVLVSQKKLTEEQIFILGSKYGFDTTDAENLTDESVKAGVIVKIGNDVFIDNIEESQNVVTIITARKVDSKIIEKIAKKFGVDSSMVNAKTDESILGGIVIKYADKLYDGSLKTQINDLQLKLKK